MTKENLLALLNETIAASSGIQRAFIVTSDGLMIANSSPNDDDEDYLATLNAALWGLGQKSAQKLGDGALKRLWLECSEGDILIVPAGEEAVLAITFRPGANREEVVEVAERTAVEAARRL